MGKDYYGKHMKVYDVHESINISSFSLSFQAWPVFLYRFLTLEVDISTFLVERQFLCMAVNWTILNL